MGLKEGGIFLVIALVDERIGQLWFKPIYPKKKVQSKRSPIGTSKRPLLFKAKL
jgi:hypothetical protein